MPALRGPLKLLSTLSSSEMRLSPSIRLLLTAAGVVGVDQAVKIAVASRLRIFELVQVVPGFFNITYIRNPGAAFGFLSNLDPPWGLAVFGGAAVLAALALCYLYFATSPELGWTRLGIALVLGGALGNLIDRVRFGEVVDFIDLHWGTYHWPSFNVADSAITVGVALIVLETIFRKRKPRGG